MQRLERCVTTKIPMQNSSSLQESTAEEKGSQIPSPFKTCKTDALLVEILSILSTRLNNTLPFKNSGKVFLNRN